MMTDFEYLDRFLQGMAAAIHLLNKGIEKRGALECIVLQVNLIDGMLRLGLILQQQLDEKSNLLDVREYASRKEKKYNLGS